MRGLLSPTVFFVLGAVLTILGVALIATGGVGAGIFPLVLGVLTLARGAQLRHVGNH